MKHYTFEASTEAEEALEELRKKLAEVVGVTLVGTRLTLRWTNPLNNRWKYVSFLAVEIEDGGKYIECQVCGSPVLFGNYEEDSLFWLCDDCRSPK